MKTLPSSVKTELTKACLIVYRSENIASLSLLAIEEQTIKAWGFEYPQWLNMLFEWKLKKIYLTAEEYFKEKNSHLCNEYIKSIDRAIQQVCVPGDSAMENALYAIASQIIEPDLNYDDSLGFEFHCKFNEWSPLGSASNFELFKSMLSREIAFWQTGIKLSAPPSSSKSSINPVLNPNVLNAFKKNKSHMSPK